MILSDGLPHLICLLETEPFDKVTSEGIFRWMTVVFFCHNACLFMPFAVGIFVKEGQSD